MTKINNELIFNGSQRISGKRFTTQINMLLPSTDFALQLKYFNKCPPSFFFITFTIHKEIMLERIISIL